MYSIGEFFSTNFSKAAMAFPDFPFPDAYPDYMTHEMVLQYLRNYAHKFDLMKHIKVITVEYISHTWLTWLFLH